MQGNFRISKFPPTFDRGTVVLDYTRLRYNPCDDLIFPSVIRVADLFPKPLGAYYMYYAPHNAPGGICLAYADALEGPWTEYENNPLIRNTWPPHYTVRHISSPHAVHVPEASRLFLVYHGDNDTTRYATSEDGIAFEYGGTAVDKNCLDNLDGTTYARMFRYPGSSGPGKYVLLYMAFKIQRGQLRPFEHHGLYAAWSDDARTWRYERQPILQQSDLGSTEFICSPWLASWKDQLYLLFHRDFIDESRPGRMWTDAYMLEVDSNLKRTGDPELFCSRQIFSEDNARLSDPCLLVEGDTFYLFGSIGPRLNQKIGLTKGRLK